MFTQEVEKKEIAGQLDVPFDPAENDVVRTQS